MLSLCVVLSLSLFVNMEMCALVCFPSLTRRLLLSFTKNARSHEQSNKNNESRRHLFSRSSFTAVMMPFRKGVSTARVKANKRMGLSVKRFSLETFSSFLLPFFLSINWAVFLRVSFLVVYCCAW